MIWPPGLPGPQGAAGAQGATGPQGASGAAGAQGAQGPQGLVGAVGLQGAIGAQGAIGLQGATGTQGSTGAQGVTGAQGAAGVQGSQGSNASLGRYVVFLTNYGGGAYAWTNQPSTLQELRNTDNHRYKIDLSNATRARLTAYLSIAGATNAILALQYSTDGGTNWSYADGSSGPTVAINAAAMQVGNWANLTANAKADVLLRIVGEGGNSTADPTFIHMLAEIQ